MINNSFFTTLRGTEFLTALEKSEPFEKGIIGEVVTNQKIISLIMPDGKKDSVRLSFFDDLEEEYRAFVVVDAKIMDTDIKKLRDNGGRVTWRFLSGCFHRYYLLIPSNERVKVTFLKKREEMLVDVDIEGNSCFFMQGFTLWS